MEFRVPDEKRKLYLSAIIDLYDRYPVAHVNCNLVNNGGFIIVNVYFNIGLDTKTIFGVERNVQHKYIDNSMQ